MAGVSVPIEAYFPAIIAIGYYAFVFFFAEILRKLLDATVKKSSLLYVFLIELIGTAQMCTAVFENALVIRKYGNIGFFLVVIALQLSGNFLNRGAYITPLPVIEQFLNNKIRPDKFLALLSAQTIGGYSAFRLANALWYYSLNYSADHFQLFEHLPCAIVYKVPYSYAFLNELVGSFLLRYIIHRLPNSSKFYITPALVASLLTFSLSFIGIPGLNPVVTSSRLQGCPGLDLQWFMITYWVCPAIGWLLAAQLDKNSKARGGSKKEKQKKS